MTAYAASLYRDVTCAAAAIAITAVLGMSFVQSTSAAPFHVAPATVQTLHAHQPAQQA